MRKATQKAAAPASLGNKRTCPKCSTKFYDFNKQELTCPKCDTKFKVSEMFNVTLKSSEAKKVAKKALPEEALMDSEDLVVQDSSDNFESVEELGDDEDEVVEDIKVEDNDDESY